MISLGHIGRRALTVLCSCTLSRNPGYHNRVNQACGLLRVIRGSTACARHVSTNGKLERFIDEADQALGRRDASSGDSGVGGHIYSMLAEEMGSSTNRGRVIWVLASSRPDLIEVDLKRPGRVDLKIPLFPTTTPREGFDLLRMLCGKRGLAVPENSFPSLESRIPSPLDSRRCRSPDHEDLPSGPHQFVPA